MRRGVLPRRLIFAIAWFSLTYHLGIIRLSAPEEAIPYLRGLRRDKLEEIARETFERWLRNDIFPGAVALVRRLHDEGRRVMIATSSIDFIVAPLADYLGIDGILATSLEFQGGTCTGRMVGAPMFHGEKKNAVLAYLAEDRDSCRRVLFLLRQRLRPPAARSRGKTGRGQPGRPAAPRCPRARLAHHRPGLISPCSTALREPSGIPRMSLPRSSTVRRTPSMDRADPMRSTVTVRPRA